MRFKQTARKSTGPDRHRVPGDANRLRDFDDDGFVDDDAIVHSNTARPALRYRQVARKSTGPNSVFRDPSVRPNLIESSYEPRFRLTARKSTNHATCRFAADYALRFGRDPDHPRSKLTKKDPKDEVTPRRGSSKSPSPSTSGQSPSDSSPDEKKKKEGWGEESKKK